MNLYKIIPTYHTILYLLGFGWEYNPVVKLDDISKDRDIIENNSVIINIDIDNHNKVNVKQKEINQNSKIILFILNILYSFFIFIIILSPFIYSVIIAIIYNNILYITNNIFQILLITQYIVGYTYFSKKHFYEILKSSKLIYITYTVCIYAGIVFSLAISIMSIIFLTYNIQVNAYSDIMDKVNSNISQDYVRIIITILVYIYLFFEKLLSYACFFSNTITFSTVMIYHKAKINEYSKKVEDNKNMSFATTVDSVCKEFFNMKNEYGKTVKNFNYIFSSINIFGLLSMYFVLVNMESSIYVVLDMINIILFLLVDFVYIYSINQVRKSIDSIKDVITDINYISRILDDIQSISINEKTNDNSYKGMVAATKTSRAIDWIITRDSLNSEWDSFKLLGFSITDSYIIEKVFGLIIMYLIITNMNLATLLDPSVVS